MVWQAKLLKKCVRIHEHLFVVSVLEALRLALVRADQEGEIVFAQDAIRHVRAKVAAATAEGVGRAARRSLRVAPQDVQNLQETTFSLIKCRTAGHVRMCTSQSEIFVLMPMP